MEETGKILPLLLLIPLVVLPLVAIIFLLFRGSFAQGIFLLLLVLNVILLAETLYGYSSQLFNTASAPDYAFHWNITVYTLLLLLFRELLKKFIPVHWIQYLLVIHLTVVATLLITKNMKPFVDSAAVAAALELSFLGFVSLIILVRNKDPYILQSPLFWISAGTLFYFLLFLAVESSINFKWMNDGLIKEKPFLLAAFGIGRLLLYLVACLVYPVQQKKINRIKKSFRESHPQ